MSSDISFKKALICIDILILDLHSKTSVTGVIKYLADGKANDSMDDAISSCFMCHSSFQDDFGNIYFAQKVTPISALKKNKTFTKSEQCHFTKEWLSLTICNQEYYKMLSSLMQRELLRGSLSED